MDALNNYFREFHSSNLKRANAVVRVMKFKVNVIIIGIAKDSAIISLMTITYIYKPCSRLEFIYNKKEMSEIIQDYNSHQTKGIDYSVRTIR